MDKNNFKVPNSIFEAGLTKYELLVLVYLIYRRNNDQIIFPNYRVIAKACSISNSKVIKTVRGLTEKGIIRKQTRSHSYRKRYHNLYVIVL